MYLSSGFIFLLTSPLLSRVLILKALSAFIAPNVANAAPLPKLVSKMASTYSILQVSNAERPACVRSDKLLEFNVCESGPCLYDQDQCGARLLECQIGARESKGKLKLDNPLVGSEYATQSLTPVSDDDDTTTTADDSTERGVSRVSRDILPSAATKPAPGLIKRADGTGS